MFQEHTVSKTFLKNQFEVNLFAYCSQTSLLQIAYLTYDKFKNYMHLFIGTIKSSSLGWLHI